MSASPLAAKEVRTSARNPPPRVLVIDNAPVLGGVMVTLSHVLPVLGQAGYAITVAVPSSSTEGIAWYRDVGLSVVGIDLPPARSPHALLRGARGIAGAVREVKAQVVHANSTRAGLAAVFARLVAPVPVIWTVHEANVLLATRLASSLASAVLYRSESQRGQYRWFRQGHMRRVYAGAVDRVLTLDERITVRTSLLEELQFPADAELVGQLGTLTWWKGHDVFVRAAAEISRRNPRARFVICGARSPFEPKLATKLGELATALGVGDRLALLGFRPDAHQLVGALDVLVHAPVFAESFGIVVAEAMSHSLPPVVSDLGSMRELVDDGVHGLRFPAGDATALADCVYTLLENRELRARLGAAARAKYERLFRIDDEIAAYAQIYDELAQRRPRRVTP